MLQIKTFSFNHFAVNTYVVYDETKECILVDVACTSPEEQEKLKQFITKNELKPVKILLTHAHIDHIAGLEFACTTYSLPVTLHKDGLLFLQESSIASGAMMGFDISATALNNVTKEFITEGQTITFGNSSLKVLETPGHAAGSLCFVSENPWFAITGDVLFKESIGRSDFVTGDLDLLLGSIKTKLLTLPADTKVFPGHGPASNIGDEINHNPFLSPLFHE